jgi:prepilin-type N-terminal cleavage/methylation domain-containing protein
MPIDSCRHWGVSQSFSAALRASAPTRAAQQGFTLVELLVGVVLGSVVLSSLGALLMLSEVKVAARIQRNLDDKDAANRTIDLMRREATFSRYFVQPLPDFTGSKSPFADCNFVGPVAYVQRNNAKICYKLVALSDLPVKYQSAFSGPCVLVRLGSLYKPNGDLDTSADPIPQPLLDGVAKDPPNAPCTSTKAKGFSAIMVDEEFNRNADVTIRLHTGSVYDFSVRVPSNPRHDANDLYNPCSSATKTGCGEINETTYHFKPAMDTLTEAIDGKDNKENLFYFQYPYSDYVLSEDASSGSCRYSKCYVQRKGAAVQLKNVDGLIFPDQEIRPGN